MLDVFICDDIREQRENIKKIVENVIVFENYPMKVRANTDNPYDIIEYIKNSPTIGLYFLDVDLKRDINGVKLAEMIREYDPRGFIVIVTAYPKTLPLIFRHKIEAMDFIEKTDYFGIRQRIEDCVRNAYKKHTAKTAVKQKQLSIKVKDQIISVSYEKIVSIETSPHRNHRLIITFLDERYEFYGMLKDVEKALDNRFIRPSKSFILNIKQIRALDVPKKAVIMNNGMRFPIPTKKMAELKKCIQADY